MNRERFKAAEIVNKVRSLRSETGYLALVGLYWLKDGRHAFGSAPARAPGVETACGVGIWSGRRITCTERAAVERVTEPVPTTGLRLRWSVPRRDCCSTTTIR